jgi:hypothetical protein
MIAVVGIGIGFHSSAWSIEPRPSLASLQAAITALTTRVSTLETENADLKAQVDALPAAPDLSDYVKTDDLPADISTLSTSVTTLNKKLACVSSTSTATKLIFEGCNVHVRNGTGDTTSKNRYGNLIIGYNKSPPVVPMTYGTGSHNLVIGDMNDYTATGGLVAGYGNTITADFSSISGGYGNTASGKYSSISGGDQIRVTAEKGIPPANVDLTPYAKTAELPAFPDLTAFLTAADLTPYAKTAELPAFPDLTAFLTAADLAPYAKKTDVPSLSGYVTTAALGTTLSAYLKTAELPVLTNLTDFIATNAAGNVMSSTNLDEFVTAICDLQTSDSATPASFCPPPPLDSNDPATRYQVIGDGSIIRDVVEGYEWQRCIVGWYWDGSTCKDDTNIKDTYTYAEAIELTATGGFRIPTIDQLKTLVYCSSTPITIGMEADYTPCSGTYTKPTIVAWAFPNTPSSWFWSGSPNANDSSYAWGVSFGYGYAYDGSRYYSNHFRLVRGGQ